MSSEKRSRVTFGAEERIPTALESGTIDAYDLVCLDSGEFGWINKSGQFVKVKGEKQVVTITDEQLPASGSENVIYIFQGIGYVWTGEKFQPLTQTVDVKTIEAELAKKVDEKTVDTKITNALAIVEF